MYIKKFDQISKENIKEVGGKGASLGELVQAGFPVPPGFVITTKTFEIFFNQDLPIDVKEEIFRAFDELGVEKVAVRSSAIAEDSEKTSWAGQLETYLNVKREDLIEKIRDCWNSVMSEKALSYAVLNSINEQDLKIAVVVQKMVDSESSGVIFTVNPVTKNTDEIMIEAGFGLGEYLVQGLITPDNFLVDKKTLEIKKKEIGVQDKMLVFRGGKNQEVVLSEEEGNKQAISDDLVIDLTKIGQEIEKHFGRPQDIEWALEEGQLCILQSRPITTLI